jgi:ABC-type glutathione transport system ATPase component
VFDEPVSYLGAVRLEIVRLLASLRDDGLALVLISHELGVVEPADRILVMHAGRVVEALATQRPDARTGMPRPESWPAPGPYFSLSPHSIPVR